MEKINNLVSVIIPTYGGGQYLQRAIDSVLNQTYQNIEIIIVDDNGVDTPNQIATGKVVEDYKDNLRVKYVCHDVNKNGSAARNTGFAYSNGEYIALLDDDDEYLPNKIEKQVEDLERLDSSYALVYCRFKAVFTDKVVTSKLGGTGNVFYDLMMHKMIIGSSSLLMHRHVWREMNGFDESFKRHQDYEFTARIAFKYKVYAEDFVGYVYYILDRNTPQNPYTTVDYRKHYINKMMPYLETLPKRERNNIIDSNIMDVCLQYIYHGQLKNFVKSFIYTRPSFRAFIYMIKTTFKDLNRKMVKVLGGG